MATPIPILFDEVAARLPLFEDLPQDAPERLAVAGLGRGLLTTSVRGRLRKAGFVDMGTLALATPAELTQVRKIGPVRLQAIRAHVLDELARMYPDARAVHAAGTTTSRRLDRLRTIPAARLPLETTALAALGCAGDSCAALSMRARAQCLKAPTVTAGDLDRVVITLVRFLLHDRPRLAPSASPVGEPHRDDGQKNRARMQQQDREWEAADPNIRRRNP